MKTSYKVIVFDPSQVTVEQIEQFPGIAVLDVDAKLLNVIEKEVEEYENFKEELRRDHVQGEVDEQLRDEANDLQEDNLDD